MDEFTKNLMSRMVDFMVKPEWVGGMKLTKIKLPLSYKAILSGIDTPFPVKEDECGCRMMCETCVHGL